MKTKDTTDGTVEVQLLTNVYFLSTGDTVLKDTVISVTPEKAKELINSKLAKENAN